MTAREANLALPPQFDLLLKGGRVIDPKKAISTRMDVAVTKGRIASLAKEIPASRARQTVDVSPMPIVSPLG